MLDAQLFAFCGVALLLALMPGADTALVTKNTIARGRGAAAATTMGIAMGCLVHAAASALGLSVILAKSAEAFHAMKLIGAGYLVWIGVRAVWEARSIPVSGEGRESEIPAGQPKPGQPNPMTVLDRKSFSEGLLTNLLNPKVALFYLLVLPRFIEPHHHVFARSMLLAGIHIGFGVLWLNFYATLLDRMRGFFSRTAIRKRLEYATGGLLVLLGIRLAWERRS